MASPQGSLLVLINDSKLVFTAFYLLISKTVLCSLDSSVASTNACFYCLVITACGRGI